MLDLRGYAGKMVLVGQLESSYHAKGFTLERCYVLGTVEDGGDVPETVRSILEDLEAESEAAEVLWVLEVDAQGVPVRRIPLVVFDTQERLRYGADFLEAVVQTGIGAEALIVRGVQMADPAC